ncbi:Phospholipase A2 [Toxocara canis]|uniref:Phospholipase A2 n=1 Tax=Toxocara canis TaxID=6265 RepID=A0A0B2UUD8_TOXCA|nr:Phospholipase A2 [Toxocara canis]
MQARWLFAYAVIAVSARSVDKATGDEKHTGALELVPQFEPSNFSVSFVPRSKAMWNMEGMSECMLHYSAIIYNGYGCYCGFGGSGTPVDDIDECCMHHDNCYEDAISKHGCTSSPMLYFTSYHWDCIDSKISCRLTGNANTYSAVIASNALAVSYPFGQLFVRRYVSAQLHYGQLHRNAVMPSAVVVKAGQVIKTPWSSKKNLTYLIDEGG